MSMDTRICQDCGVSKHFSEFYSYTTKKGSNLLRLSCKPCMRAAKPTYKKYNLTIEQFNTLLNKHDGLCWACKLMPATCIDHNHLCCPGPNSCGKCVRGVLCKGCNTFVGHLESKAQRLKACQQYLIDTQ